MSFTPLTFSGISSYSSDFQTVLTRAVKIASLPLQALQNENSDVLARKTQLGTIGTAVANLTSAFESLAKVSGEKGLQASSSNTAAVTIGSISADSAATYTINSITSLAAAASETSASGYADSSSTAVSTTGTVKLTVGAKDYTINLGSANNNLAGLRNAINALGAGVTASIITTGTGANPNYLSVSANVAGETVLKIVDDPGGVATNLLTTANQGTNAVFQLNGLPVSRTSNQVHDVVPGVSFSLVGKTSSPVTLTLATQKSKLEDSLSAFVTAYNSVSEAVSAQVGPSAGLLSGDFLVREIQKAQREVTNFTSGNLALSDLGITFDSAGKASFDASKIEGYTDTQLNDAFSFLGSASTGLGAISKRFSQISDPVTGLIKLQQDSYDRTDQRLQDQISELETRIDNMQKSTAARLQQIDALLGTLQSQQNVIDASIKSANLALYGRSDK